MLSLHDSDTQSLCRSRRGLRSASLPSSQSTAQLGERNAGEGRGAGVRVEDEIEIVLPSHGGTHITGYGSRWDGAPMLGVGDKKDTWTTIADAHEIACCRDHERSLGKGSGG